MNIYLHSAEEVESFVRANHKFLDKQVKNKMNPGLKLESIARNPNQGGRKSIYDLQMSDGSRAVLKLYSKEGAKTEVEGLKHASASELPSPRLFCHDLSDKNPLQNAYLIMEYVESIPGESIFIGDFEFTRWGRTLKINKEALRKHVHESIDICVRLHQVSSPRNEAYYHKTMQGLYDRCIRIIGRETDEAFQEKLVASLNGLFKYFESNKELFINSPRYHLHRDLDPSNILRTQKGLVLIDWEHYCRGDCADEIAYFALRNMWLPQDREEQIGNICERYSKADSSFRTRLGFYMPFSALWHVITKKFPKEEFLEIKEPRPISN